MKNDLFLIENKVRGSKMKDLIIGIPMMILAIVSGIIFGILFAFAFYIRLGVGIIEELIRR